MPKSKINLSVVAATFVAIMAFAIGAKAQLTQDGESDLTNPFQPLQSDVTENQIFAELLAHNELRRQLPTRITS
ncbi:MAG: hypothetical protein WB660_22695 [Candidatus Sulfotelmatobacter sp.]